MIAEYFIYRRKGDKEPFISLGEMPAIRVKAETEVYREKT